MHGELHLSTMGHILGCFYTRRWVIVVHIGTTSVGSIARELVRRPMPRAFAGAQGACARKQAQEMFRRYFTLFFVDLSGLSSSTGA